MNSTEIRIKLADPGISPSDEQAALRVLRSGRLVTGPEVAALEQALCTLTGRKHAIATSSGTTALFAAMLALDIRPESTTIVPGLTFPAPATAAGFLGSKVIACDVDPGTLNLSRDTLQPHLADDLSLVVAIDQFGNPAPVPEIEMILDRSRTRILVDAACSMGSTLNGLPCGGLGDAAIFSFHPRKVITTGEGGVVLTNDDTIAEKVHAIVHHGQTDGVFSSLGLNLRMSEIAAAIGRTQLKRLESIVDRRRVLAARYITAVPLDFQTTAPGAVTNRQTLVAVLPKHHTADDRSDLMQHLRSHGIESQIASYCLGALGELSERLHIDADQNPTALAVHHRGIALPLHAKLSDSDVDEVIEQVLGWLRQRGDA